MVYDRTAVVAARRTGGLAVNLGMRPSRFAIPEAPATARSEATPVAPAAVRRPSDPRLVATVQYAGTRPRMSAAIDAAASCPRRARTGDRGAEEDALEVLRRDARTGDRGDDDARRRRGAPDRDDRDQERREGGYPARCSEPSIWIETLDGEDRPVQIVAIDRIRVETTSVEKARARGRQSSTRRLVYRTPTLGARQRLRVAVSHVRRGRTSLATTDLARPGDRN